MKTNPNNPYDRTEDEIAADGLERYLNVANVMQHKGWPYAIHPWIEQAIIALRRDPIVREGPPMADQPPHHDRGEVIGQIRAAADNGGANEGQCYAWWRALTEAKQQGPGEDGWQRMTQEARAIQMRHVDKHDGDVYHAMQSLVVKHGFRSDAPLTQPITTQPPHQDRGEGEK